MNEKEKKLLIKVSVIILIVVALGLSIAWLVINYTLITDWKESLRGLFAWLFSNFGSLTFGIIIKIMINKRHLNDIDKKLIDSGLKEKVVKNKQKEPAVKDKKVKNTIESRRISGY